MTQQENRKRELRAAFTRRELDKARNSVPTGPIGVFLRVTLAIIFMYMIVIAFEMFGVAGPVVVSVLFLVALFVPTLYQALITRQERRREKTESYDGVDEKAAARQKV